MSKDKPTPDLRIDAEVDAAVHGNEVTPLVATPPPLPSRRNSFAEYKHDGRNWITLVTGEYYPDILHDACILYAPVLQQFGTLLRASESSMRLLLNIAELPTPWMRVQVARVFRKYVSPETPVEMLKKKSKAQRITEEFGGTFRPITTFRQPLKPVLFPTKLSAHCFGSTKTGVKRATISPSDSSSCSNSDSQP